MYLTEKGFSTYYSLTLWSYWANYLTDIEFLSRISWLRSVCNPRDHFLKKVLDQYPDIEFEVEGRREEDEIGRLESLSESSVKVVKYRATSKPPRLYFLTRLPGILGDYWKFNPFDDDYFPSVPHGHQKSQNAVKMDAYLGNTYDTSNNNIELKRERKDYIIALWNDDKFRAMAQSAVEYYLIHHPAYHWRVTNPLLLPRRR